MENSAKTNKFCSCPIFNGLISTSSVAADSIMNYNAPKIFFSKSHNLTSKYTQTMEYSESILHFYRCITHGNGARRENIENTELNHPPVKLCTYRSLARRARTPTILKRYRALFRRHSDDGWAIFEFALWDGEKERESERKPSRAANSKLRLKSQSRGRSKLKWKYTNIELRF